MKRLQIYTKAQFYPSNIWGPVWIEAMNFEHNRLKYIRVQRLIYIQMAKAFRTSSSEVFAC